MLKSTNLIKVIQNSKDRTIITLWISLLDRVEFYEITSAESNPINQSSTP